MAANLGQTWTSSAGTGFTKRIVTSLDGDIAEDRILTAAGSYGATAPLGSAGPVDDAGGGLSRGRQRFRDTEPPTAPGPVTASAVSSGEVDLSWGAATDNVGVTGYRVERCTGTGCSSFVPVAAPAGTTFNDTGLSPATTYGYRVRAADAAGNLGPYSNVARPRPGDDAGGAGGGVLVRRRERADGGGRVGAREHGDARRERRGRARGSMGTRCRSTGRAATWTWAIRRTCS